MTAFPSRTITFLLGAFTLSVQALAQPVRTAEDVSPALLQRGGPRTFSSVQINVDSNGSNIVGDEGENPTLAVDPNDPQHLSVVWTGYLTATVLESHLNHAVSLDGGATWSNLARLSPRTAATTSLHSAVDVDSQGACYLVAGTLNFPNYFRSLDGGVTWEEQFQLSSRADQWITIDRASDALFVVESESGDSGIALFRSFDYGLTFSQHQPFPLLKPSLVTATTSAEGELLVAGKASTTHLRFCRSASAAVPNAPVVVELDVSVFLGANTATIVGPNPVSTDGRIWVAADRSQSATAGNFYLLASADPPGEDPLDVLFVASTDGGATWGTPVRVNDDPTVPAAAQWFGAMDVAPTGRIDAIWYDTRQSPAASTSELYYAYSLDGGASWSANEAVSTPFANSITANPRRGFGDNIAIRSVADGAHVVFTATFNGEHDVFYMFIGTHDCNANGVADELDVSAGTSADCNANAMPDECESAADCDSNGEADICQIATDAGLDCNRNRHIDHCEIVAGSTPDCDGNLIPESCDLAGGTAADCNVNLISDACDIAPGGASQDCNTNAIPDECELAAGSAYDCNGSGVPDECKISAGVSADCDSNALPDVCEIAAGSADDCNTNGIPEHCDLSAGTVVDCDGGGAPDTCDLVAGIHTDCNANGVLDVCEIAAGSAADCNMDGFPDECVARLLDDTFTTTALDPATWTVISGATVDDVGNNEPSPPYSLRMNSAPSATDIAATRAFNLAGADSAVLSYHMQRGGFADPPGTLYQLWAEYRDPWGVWQKLVEYRGTGVAMTQYAPASHTLPPFAIHRNFAVRFRTLSYGGGTNDWFVDNVSLELRGLRSPIECDGNGLSDSCEIASGAGADCDYSGTLDSCDIADGLAPDCNANAVPDFCDLRSGVSFDRNGNGVPDECDPDCNSNGLPDDYDLAEDLAPDCNQNQFPDSCDIAAGTAYDCNGDQIPDVCLMGAAEVGKFVPSGIELGDEFGGAVAAEGGTILMGAPFDNAAGTDTGAVYVGAQLSGVLYQTQKLLPSDGLPGDHFGSAVDLDAGRAAIGAPERDSPGADAGSVYIFEQDDGLWSQVERIEPSDAAANDRFGGSVGLSGEWLAVGAYLHDAAGSDAGAVYVFHQVNGVWAQFQKLIPPAVNSSDRLGFAVSLDGSTLVVGAPNAGSYDTFSGSVFVYQFDGTTWQYRQQVEPASHLIFSQLGRSLALKGDLLLVGAPSTGQLLTLEFPRGYAYTFRRINGTWQEWTELSSSRVSFGAQFGCSVAIGEHHLIVGAQAENTGGTKSGMVVLYEPNGAFWKQIAEFKASDRQANSLFGSAVAFDGNSIVVGARGDDRAGTNAGAVYQLSLHSDCDMNNHLDYCEIADGLASDCNGNFIPDGCELDPAVSDCDSDGLLDVCAISAGSTADCNVNGIPDACEGDCDSDGIPDDCQSFIDCNTNAVRDACEVAAGSAADCNANQIPDDCESDCDSDGNPDGCEPDCNSNGVPDDCDRTGDLTGDGYCNADDWQWLHACLSPPCGAAACEPPTYVDACCGVADMDRDGDVDLRDYAILQTIFDRFCVHHDDCDDGVFCTGAETCVNGECNAGTPPCVDPESPICDEGLNLCRSDMFYEEGFSAYPCNGNALHWLDTGANNSLVADDSQFMIGCPQNNRALRAVTTQLNTHSHYAPPGSEAWPVRSFRGRMMTTSLSAGLGVTFLSDYPNSDSYYRLRRGPFAGGTSFHVDPHGTTITSGTTNSGLSPAPNVWYWFHIEVVDTGTETQIRARIWAMGTDEPAVWQIDCADAGATRRTTGRIGVWSMQAAGSYWDDFEVE